MMTASGARGNKGNIGQLGGMRGLMADPSGRIIDLPIRCELPRGHDGARVLHLDPRRPQGSGRHRAPHRRLGLPDPAPVDVAQDVITQDEDCGTEEGIWIIRAESTDETDRLPATRSSGVLRPAALRRSGRSSSRRAKSRRLARRAQRARSPRRSRERIDEAGVDEVLVRSPLTCEARHGVCRRATAATWPPATWSASARRSASSPPSRSASPARS